ncbi:MULTISPECIES: geranylgeranyl reductase family protein [Micromonospora]|uniref:Geranylgeranyl reductase family protein n=1 Tax=Micromonospora aurantiaca (nom. illeg.) TaxID=47850 RepID=A0A1C6T9R1_9ACTN|nr:MULTISPECIES: geranylgeranyl reductase family protein [Micromonospora]AXH90211.1 geranylgeranyl reductase family protein [Micromonospora aurantiaca]KAB1115297.1 geranylgeranyl reductase family protein [Micromonospora aurantiaca]MBC9001007.1 geranylgeranyl reductase family protein [Micromonospora aurantiaca]MBF5032309.1 geranylgeranyl reductase family protein [Micromonospora sp. ANENR4]MCZ7478733.1 geranylgeranyl reductase family protein [Micromonospora sp. WMMC273]
MTAVENDADVIVVGAGPGGSATAYHLARHGVRVLLLEKTEFPREKVCGDGLTPRAVRQLIRMGVDTSPEAGWLHNKGLRVIGGGIRLELDWPDLASFPNYGLVRTRLDFDDLLAQRAVAAGAKLQTSVNVLGPVLGADDRVIGVQAEVGPDKEPATFHAPLVVAADGVSGRFPLALGLAKREDRPIGVAVRRYYRSPAKHDDDYLESWLELRAKGSDALLPGYGWIFGLGDGRVNVGLGVLNSSSAFGKTNYRKLLTDWLANTPEDWGMTDESNAEGPILGAALPMGFNRVPHYTRGVLLVGDSGGMVNPFNGEGIAYAMESGEMAAEVVVQALARPAGAERERALMAYPQELKARFGGYYRLGGVFVKLIGRPEIMRMATKHGMPHPMLMRFVLKLLANLTDPRGGDAMDRVINAMTKVAPAV